MTPAEPRDEADSNACQVILAQIRSFDGLSGTVTLHIKDGKLMHIEQRRVVHLTASGGKAVA